ncbi:hypothetical protein GCM10020367_59970 [Streptomyces sannanensis]|uniref:Uncharacterized protein n=1 Tax=Streptomyces sannanensis TaxID=285536 RepID=A0ABP6SK02_9ACTN
MTSPRSTYGGGYHSAPSFKDTPIYDSLVAERGMPQIAPIRVPSVYEAPSSNLPALPAALPALPAAPSFHTPAYGYPQQAPLQHTPAPHIPQQPQLPRGYPGAQQQFPGTQPQFQQRPAATGYEAMRPAAPQPAPTPMGYDAPHNRPPQGMGY